MTTLRLLTWNVHGCVGLDGRHDVDRVADVIAENDVDVALLQELDVARPRSDCVDQPHAIAVRVGGEVTFGAAIRNAEQGYGNAIVTRGALVDPETIALPGTRGTEPRAATRAYVLAPLEVELVVTHLGLRAADRVAQANAIVAWLGPLGPRPRIVAGDLNALARSGVVRTLSAGLVRADSAPTFPARAPMLRIDHVMVDPRLEIAQVQRLDSTAVRRASDHLPILVTLRARRNEPS